jgi:hypothetical protein
LGPAGSTPCSRIDQLPEAGPQRQNPFVHAGFRHAANRLQTGRRLREEQLPLAGGPAALPKRLELICEYPSEASTWVDSKRGRVSLDPARSRGTPGPMLFVSWLIPFGAIMFAVMAFVVVRFVLMGWRFLRGDEEMEPGGSYGRQLFGRRKNRNSV